MANRFQKIEAIAKIPAAQKQRVDPFKKGFFPPLYLQPVLTANVFI